MADYKIEVFSSLCSLETFIINGIQADEDDFVNKYDHSPETAEAHACGDMRADIKSVSLNVLEKYKINADEYSEIAEKVAEAVSFGCCGLCV